MAKDSLRRLFITIDIINAEIIIHAKQYNYLAEEIRLDDGMFGASGDELAQELLISRCKTLQTEIDK